MLLVQILWAPIELNVMPKKAKAAKGATEDASDAVMAEDVLNDTTQPSTPASSGDEPDTQEIRMAAKDVLSAYSSTRGRIDELAACIGELGALHGNAVSSAGEEARILGAVPKDSNEYAAWQRAGEDVLCLLASVAGDVREAFSGSSDVCEKLRPLQARAEEVRLVEENLAYEREMLKRDIQVQKGFYSKELKQVELASVEDTLKAAGVWESLGMLLPSALGGGAGPPDGDVAEVVASVANVGEQPTTPTSTRGRKSGRRTSSRTRRGGEAEVGGDPDTNQNNNSTSGNTAHATHNGAVAAPEAAVPSSSSLADSKLKCCHPDIVKLGLDNADGEHALMLDRLEHELAERERLEKAVAERTKKMEACRLRNEEDRRFMANLPKYVAEVRKSLDPMRRVLSTEVRNSGDGGPLAADPARKAVPALLPAEEAALLRELPGPLFVLAREAMGARSAFGRAITYEVLCEDQDATNGATPAQPELPLYPTPSKKDMDLIRKKLIEFRAEGTPATAATLSAPGSRSGTGSCEAFQGEVDLPANGTAAIPRKEQVLSLHKAHRRLVRIDIRNDSESGGDSSAAPQNPQAKSKPNRSRTRKRGRSESASPNESNGVEKDGPELSLFFRFHPALEIVTVSCVSRNLPTPLTTDDLCALFPFDFGDRSPNPANAHWLDGTFEWDRQHVAGGGRPYLWANLLCGLHFPGILRSNMNDVQEVIPGEFLRWPEQAMNTPAHLRFVDVMRKLLQRVEQKRSLCAQLASLCSKKIPIHWTAIGLSKAPDATLSVFVPCPAEEGGDGFEWAAAINEKVIQVWAFVAEHPSGVALAGIVGIEPDYPSSKGHIRVSSQGKIVVPGADIREIEDNVNPSPPEPPLSNEKFCNTLDEKPGATKGSICRPPGTEVLSHVANGIDSPVSGMGFRKGRATGQVSGDWLSTVPDDYAISAQMMRLLYCLDTVASAIGDRARADTEVPGSEFQQDPASNVAKNGVEDGNARTSQQGPANKRRRVTRGRGRSKLEG